MNAAWPTGTPTKNRRGATQWTKNNDVVDPGFHLFSHSSNTIFKSYHLKPAHEALAVFNTGGVHRQSIFIISLSVPNNSTAAVVGLHIF